MILDTLVAADALLDIPPRSGYSNAAASPSSPNTKAGFVAGVVVTPIRE